MLNFHDFKNLFHTETSFSNILLFKLKLYSLDSILHIGCRKQGGKKEEKVKKIGVDLICIQEPNS